VFTIGQDQGAALHWAGHKGPLFFGFLCLDGHQNGSVEVQRMPLDLLAQAWHEVVQFEKWLGTVLHTLSFRSRCEDCVGSFTPIRGRKANPEITC
jgi:hypothetical protein